MTTYSLVGLLVAAPFAVQAQAKDEPKPGETMTKKDGAMPMAHKGDMKPGKGGGMKTMDINGDGMVSKDEFTKHHDALWDHMKKDSSGQVSVKDMGMMNDHPAMKK